MAHHADPGIEAFRAAFSGQALTPGHRRLRPIARDLERRHRPQARGDRVLHHGRAGRATRSASRAASGLEIAVRGGGHSYAGNSVCDGGLMIHLGAMNGVVVDPAARRAVCGGGATWADVDAATQQHGLATPGGFISHTGIAGLTLGGGIGWLTKKAGLSCDNLVAAEVVTADSRIVRASKDENPELFWALRGGGGNFGVVTSFEFALHPVGPLVNLGLFFFGLENGPQALRFARDFIKTLPPRPPPSRDRPERAARAVRPGAVPVPARARAAGRGLRIGRGAPAHRGADPQGGDAAVRAGDADSVRRAAADVQRERRVGHARLREGALPRRAVGRRHRGHRRARAEEELAVVVLPDLHAGRRVPHARRRRHGLRRQPLRAATCSTSKRPPPIASCTRPTGPGCATSGTRCGRTRRGRAAT